MSAEMTNQTKSRLLTKREAAERLRVDPYTIHRWMKSGRLKKITLSPRAVRVTEESVEALATGAAEVCT